MNNANRLIEQLSKLSGKEVELTENTIDKPLKKRFYGVSADFEKDLNRLVNFYEVNASQYPELKPLLKRVKRLKAAFDTIFAYTESFIDNGKEVMQEEETYKEVEVGDAAQVYVKGEAFIGPLIVYGKIVSKNKTKDGYEVAFDEDGPFYSLDKFDIIKIDLKDPSFQKLYPKRQLAEAPVETPPAEEPQTEPQVEPTQAKPAKVEPTNVKQPVENPTQDMTAQTNPKEFGEVATETVSLVNNIQTYVEPTEKDVADARKKIYNEFIAILKRYDKELPLNTSNTSIETLQALNDELKTFIAAYEIPVS